MDKLRVGERDAGRVQAQLPDAGSAGGSDREVRPRWRDLRLCRHGADQGDGVGDADRMEEHSGDAVRPVSEEEWRRARGSNQDKRDQVEAESWSRPDRKSTRLNSSHL